MRADGPPPVASGQPGSWSVTIRCPGTITMSPSASPGSGTTRGAARLTKPSKSREGPMRPVISVQRGAVPWQPANDAELVATFNKFNVPTLGVVRQAGVEYLFLCVSGHEIARAHVTTPVTNA